MNDFTILHLSDLHIDFRGKKLPILMENLLRDIENEMRFSSNIIIVVTGDLIHKADYHSAEGVVVFFSRLKKMLQDRVRHIYIVPGNHDKERNALDREISGRYLSETDVFYELYWKYLRLSFEKHLNLTEHIYRIFYGEDAYKYILRNTFGVRIDQVNGNNICFLLFNSAWNSGHEEDARNLDIGAFQIEEIKKSYVEKCEGLAGQKIALTIALAHHPIDWLRGNEEDMVRKELLSGNALDANVYMCGHIHNRDVINWQNNRHSLTTLVCGLGWPDGSEGHPYAHTYSSYVFNLDVNSIDVYVKSSDDNYSFYHDFRIYTNERNREYNKIVMPIEICDTHSYFYLNTSKGRSPKACFFDDRIVKEIPQYTLGLARLARIMRGRLTMVEKDIRERHNENAGEKGTVETADFRAYIQALSIELFKILNRIRNRAEIRVHFRAWERETEIYRKIGLYGSSFKEEYDLTPVPWGQLIEKAFEVGEPLIASVNSDACKDSFSLNAKRETAADLSIKGNMGAKQKKKWVDFMTFIPQLTQNIYEEREKDTEELIKRRPYITGGITIYRKEDQEMLYILEYLKIDKIVGEMINSFLQICPTNLEYQDEAKKEGNKNGQ